MISSGLIPLTKRPVLEFEAKSGLAWTDCFVL